MSSSGRVLPQSAPTVARISNMISAEYISASANRYSQAADSAPLSLVAFGSNKLVTLWDTDVCLIISARCPQAL